MRGNIAQLMQQAQKMQADMQRVQEELASLEVTGKAGGGMVEVTLTGRMECRRVRIARAAGAGRAQVVLAEVAAARAMADAFDRLGQGARQLASAFALALEHVVGHALRRLRADARQHAERFDQLFQQRGHVRTAASSRAATASPRWPRPASPARRHWPC